MRYLYNVAIWFYCLAVRVVAMFNSKVRLMWQGEREAFAKVSSSLSRGDRVVWVHAASLGEFEQGRPLIEKLKRENPEYKILLTFFSPSGYEVRKNYAMVDVIAYLPLDTAENARRFVDLVRPEKVVFVKYEFWLNYLRELRVRGVDTYIISAIFRREQVFFKWYGGLFREALTTFKKLFVQNDESAQLLKEIGIENVVVAGDTRFDRVMDVVVASKRLEVVEEFVNSQFTIHNSQLLTPSAALVPLRQGDNMERQWSDRPLSPSDSSPNLGEQLDSQFSTFNSQLPVLVVGSSWGPDEELLAEYINSRAGRVKMIIAPHEVREERIKELTDRLTCRWRLYNEELGIRSEALNEADCLVVNTMGLLSSIYQYGQVAYIGGGFGVGIHNTLEAAAWGMPVVFGPNYKKFNEACELIECGAARSIATKEECFAALDEFFEHNDKPASAAAEYVVTHIGATEMIYRELMG